MFPSQEDCLNGAPDTYEYVMHFLHVLTFPLYTLAFYLVVVKSPKSLKDYRKYLLWHTAGNLIFEIYVSIFMLPVTYLPSPVIRGAGLVKYLELSGLVQFYILVICLIHTGLSILEMFKYRFNAVIAEETFNKKLVHRSLLVFYFVAALIPTLGFSTLERCVPKQNTYRLTHYNNNPGVSIEILCNTAVIAPPLLDPVFTPFMSLISVAVIIACTTVPYSFMVLMKKLDEVARHLSQKTVQLQRMLLISLFIQTIIHGVMLAVPVIGFVYAIFFTLPFNFLGFALLILISIHGSISTIAMIGFTKPLREGLFAMLPFSKSRKFSQSVPIVLFTTTENSNSTFSHKSSIFSNRTNILS